MVIVISTIPNTSISRQAISIPTLEKVNQWMSYLTMEWVMEVRKCANKQVIDWEYLIAVFFFIIVHIAFTYRHQQRDQHQS